MTSSDEQHVTVDKLRVPLGPLLTSGARRNPDHYLREPLARRLGLPAAAIRSYQIDRRSLDARQAPELAYHYRVHVQVDGASAIADGAGISVSRQPPDENQHLYQLDLAADRPRRPIVVGTGPAGIMAAYLLALHGSPPLILDRGRDVERRSQDVAAFHQSRRLDPTSNYLFGEGGAGTFSDGKLYTRVKDHRMRFLLEAFVAARAKRSILYEHHPHIGSDILPHMARRLRQQIEAWGGSFRWEAEVVDLLVEDDRCRGVVLAGGERLSADAVCIAPGHSARDLIRQLVARGLRHKAKGFQIGCRIEHDQPLINQAQYGIAEPPAHLLGAAEYHLVSRPRQRQCAGVTTFCMCPGGEIIAATSDNGQLSTNGMSRHARNSPYANAGLIANVELDRTAGALAGFDLIDAIESAAFTAGGGDYGCPAQSATAFLRGEASPIRASSYRLGIRPGRIDQLLPPATVGALREALRFFDRRIPGFASQGQLVGVETRVSSPVRFERDPDSLASSLPGCYLAGEGAGYAGGIVSAGLDGLRLAETMLTGIPARRQRRPE